MRGGLKLRQKKAGGGQIGEDHTGSPLTFFGLVSWDEFGSAFARVSRRA